MFSSERYTSPFAVTEEPPPPVVLLLLHTDFTADTSTRLLIHEDLEQPVPSAGKTVVFAPVEHTYPPPPNFAEKIPVPLFLTRKVIEKHEPWIAKFSAGETAIIKVRLVYIMLHLLNIRYQTTVHNLVDQLLDRTKSLNNQDHDLLQEVYTQVSAFSLISFKSHCCTGRADASRPAHVCG